MNIMSYIQKLFNVLLIVLTINLNVIGQCEISEFNGERIILEPVDERTLRFLVSDAAINDLASPQQGICGVRIEFIHQDVTDLNFTLFSPSGDQVILLGPAEPMGSSLQIFGIAHDISFVPSTEAAMPDAGLSDRWDNRDPDWGDNSAYAGVYYPFGGDLDINFANGPVEGIWELRLTDQFIGGLDPSSFQKFELIFCDDQLTCQSCEAQSGTFSVDSITICEGQELSLQDIYTPIADTDEYLDILLAYSGDALFSVDAFPSFEGSFELYVLTVLRSQEQEVRNILNTINRPGLIDLVNMPGGIYCIDLSREPIIFSISQNSGIQAIISADQTSLSCEVEQIILDGFSSIDNDSTIYSWIGDDGMTLSMDQSITISDPGSYRLFISDNVCADSSSIVITDGEDNLSLEITTVIDTLTCIADRTTLGFNADFAPSDIKWTNLVGEELSTVDTLMVSMPGTYVLSITGNGDCDVSDTILIEENVLEPMSEVMSDVITCDNSQVTLRVLEPIDSYEYIWSVNDQNIGDAQSLTISAGGTYILTTIAPNGCSSTEMVDVSVDTSTVAIELPQDTFINCFIDVIPIDINVQEDIIISQSIDNGPFEIIAISHLIERGGDYRYTVNFDNGCLDTYSFEVRDDRRDTVVLTTVIDTLTCVKDSILLSSDLQEDQYSFAWQPNVGDFISEVQVREPNKYEMIATDLFTGCVTTRSFDIAVDRDDPEEIISGDTILTCLDPIANISITTDEDAAVTWTTPDQMSIAERNIEVSLPGDYSYLIEGANGCDISGVWTIAEDIEAPFIDLPEQIQLDCNQPQLIIGVDSSLYQSVSWQYDGGVVDSDSIMIAVPGEVTVSVQGVNGCDDEASILVTDDFFGPVANIINNDTTYCSVQTILVSAEEDMDGSREVNYLWFNEDLLLSEDREFLLNRYGQIRLIASYADNGCESTDMVTFSLSEEPLTGINVIAMDESCAGAFDGSLDIIGVGGGVGPYMYTLNDESVEEGAQSNLSSQDYIIEAEDANNCTIDTLVSIAGGDEVLVRLPEDIAITANEAISVAADISGDYFDLDWFVNGMLANSSQESIDLIADSDKEIIVQVLTNNGCVFTDTVLVDAIFTIDLVDLYIPNSFIVDDGGPNGSFYVSLPDEIISVDRFDIYDRWGSVIHSEENLSGSSRVQIWDGYYQGKAVNPGVFTYLCEVTTSIEGQKKNYTGTITVLR